jgi:hypothetical protein
MADCMSRAYTLPCSPTSLAMKIVYAPLPHPISKTVIFLLMPLRLISLSGGCNLLLKLLSRKYPTKKGAGKWTNFLRIRPPINAIKIKYANSIPRIIKMILKIKDYSKSNTLMMSAARSIVDRKII